MAGVRYSDGRAGQVAGTTRRGFLGLTTAALGGIGALGAVWPLVASLAPAADAQVVGLDVDLAPIAVGQSITVSWGGKPVFIRHRTPEEIRAVRETPLDGLSDPQRDEDRVQKPEWVVVVGVCTCSGFNCVLMGQRPRELRGDYGGWWCPCHNTQYDTSGRVRRGLARRNLAVPRHMFPNRTHVQLLRPPAWRLA